MLRMLLEHGAAVNVRSDTGEAALMYAAITGNVDIVKILLRCVPLRLSLSLPSSLSPCAPFFLHPS